MIISASRRTDIPAFYCNWFLKRLEEGYVFTRNPMNVHQVSRVTLNPKVVDCIVFWTKNPANMLSSLDIIDQYKYQYYFQFTVNSYGKDIETGVPKKSEIIDTFKKLSNKIGKNRVIWRYDPIFYSDKINFDYHVKYFEHLASKLKDYTTKCFISFLDFYKKTKINIRPLGIRELTQQEMKEIAAAIAKIGEKYELKIETCAEEIDLADVGIEHGKCIDERLISKLLDIRLDVKKDKTQRGVCGCAASIDIGAYNTCSHGCLYCYANFNKKTVEKNILTHDDKSPFIIGNLNPDDHVTEREMFSCKLYQQYMFESF